MLSVCDEKVQGTRRLFFEHADLHEAIAIVVNGRALTFGRQFGTWESLGGNHQALKVSRELGMNYEDRGAPSTQ